MSKEEFENAGKQVVEESKAKGLIKTYSEFCNSDVGKETQLTEEEVKYYKIQHAKEIQTVLTELNKTEEYNKRLLEKLMFALRPTDHMLDDVTKEKFKQIILENIDLETVKIKEKLKQWWECGKYE